MVARRVGRAGRFLGITSPCRFAGAPVVLWRDAAGVCRGFHNLCRHRGIRLVEGEGPIGRFVTCPYHQWTFNLDGELVRIPQPDQFSPACQSGSPRAAIGPGRRVARDDFRLYVCGPARLPFGGAASQ